MAISFLQRQNGGFTTTQASFSINFGAGTTAGSMIAVAGTFDDAAGITSVTISDGHSDTVTQILAPVDAGPNVQGKFFCYAFYAPTTGTTTITATYNGGSSTFGDLYAWEIAGLTSPIVDKIVSATGTGTTADSGSTGTLSSANEAAILYGDSQHTYSSAGSGWTNTNVNSSDGSIGAEQVLASTAAIHAIATTPSGDWGILCATFMSGGGAGYTPYDPWPLWGPVLAQ